MDRLLTSIAIITAFTVVSAWAEQPVPLIVDTDFGPDCDDAGALAVAHYLENVGEADLIGVITSTRNEHVVAAVDAVNHHYGRPNIPIGLADNGVRHRGPFVKTLADTDRFPSRRRSETAEDSTTVYRRLLHDAERPVTIAVIGYQSSLSAFLKSEANHDGDGIGLSGRELAERKVKKLVLMAGNWQDPDHREWNVKGDPAAARHIAENWPGRIIYSGYEIGDAIRTGRALSEPRFNPVAMAYKLHPGAGAADVIGDRPSWDQTAVLQAIRGTTSNGQRLWTLSERGSVTFNDQEPHNVFRRHPEGRHRYQIAHMDPEKVARIIEAMMIAPPVLDTEPARYRVTVTTPIPTVDSAVEVTARLMDGNGRPVYESGRVVRWSASNGDGFSSTRTLTNSHGRATVHFNVSAEVHVKQRVKATDGKKACITGVSPELTTMPREPVGRIAYYPLNAGGGDIAADHSGIGPPLNLDLRPGAQWVEGGNAILLDGANSGLRSQRPAKKLHQRIALTGRFTVEAWLAPSRENQRGPARIVSYSRHGGARNFTLGHGLAEDDRNNIAMLLRTTHCGLNGLPQVDTQGVFNSKRQHIVATYDGQTLRAYRNGQEVAAVQRAGALDNWNQSYFLALGAEPTGYAPWAGRLYEVAIYDRALTARQVAEAYRDAPAAGDSCRR